MAPKPFDPNTAPKAVMTGDERAAIQKDMNNLALRLRDAGILLYEYKIHDLVPYWNPFGFDFKAARWQELLKAANGAKGLGFDPIDMPLQVLLDLPFGFGEKSEVPAVAEPPCGIAESERTGVPQGVEQAQPAAQLAHALRAPGEMIGFFARSLCERSLDVFAGRR